MKIVVYETPVQSEMHLVARVAVTAGYHLGRGHTCVFCRASNNA